MNSFVHIEKVVDNIYSMRFYNISILSETDICDLPDYIGVGLLKITDGIGLISAMMFRGSNDMNMMHIADGAKLVEALGCTHVIFSRHKNGRVLMRKHKLPLKSIKAPREV